MKVALFLNEKVDDSNTNTIPIMILHMDNKSILEVEKDIIVKKDVNYLALWLLTKRIKEIYVTDIGPMTKKLFEKLGVTVRLHKDIERNPLLKKFIT